MKLSYFGVLAAVALLAGSKAEATLFYSASGTEALIPANMSVGVPLSGIIPNVTNSAPITLSNGVLIDLTGDATTLKTQGVVMGMGAHSLPVAGFSGSTASYFTGDYGSPMTTNPGAAGNYLSTGLGTLSIDFGTTELSSFVLLWGTVDAGNTLEFYQGNTEIGSLTGAQILAGPHGTQRVGGSLYIAVDSDIQFDKVVMTSSVMSFEATALEGDIGYLDIPEPASLATVGAGLFGLTMIMRRRQKRV